MTLSRDFLSQLKALARNPYDREASEANLRAYLQAALPNWEPDRDELLSRALPLISEYLFLQVEMINNDWHNGQMVNAQGLYLDAFGVQRPPILRTVGESDEDYLFRLANSGASLNIGSLASIEASVRAFNNLILDVQAVTNANRQDVNVYALKAALAALSAAEQTALSAHLNDRANKIAGTELTVASVTQTAFTIDVTLRHAADVAADVITADARMGLYAWLAAGQKIGQGVYRSAIIAEAHVPGVSDVTVAQPSADLAETAGTVYTCPSDTTNVVIRTSQL